MGMTAASPQAQLAAAMQGNGLAPALKAVRNEESGTLWLLMKPV
jgi:hypothetical protein